MNFKIGITKSMKDQVTNSFIEYNKTIYGNDMPNQSVLGLAKKTVKRIYSPRENITFLGLYADNDTLIAFATISTIYSQDYVDAIVHEILIIDENKYMDYIKCNIYTTFLDAIEYISSILEYDRVYVEFNKKDANIKNSILYAGYIQDETGNKAEYPTDIYWKSVVKNKARILKNDNE